MTSVLAAGSVLRGLGYAPAALHLKTKVLIIATDTLEHVSAQAVVTSDHILLRIATWTRA